MAKEKDIHVTNNINIKVDGEKKKKKRKSRKGKNKKSKKYMKTLADGKQYPHTGQIYSTGAIQPAPIAQPPPIPELDYHKFAENYLSTKKRPLAIADKERPLLIKDVDRSKAIIPKTPTNKLKEIEPLPIKSASKKPILDFDSYGKRVNKKIKNNAIILSEEFLSNPKNITIKKEHNPKVALLKALGQ